jgi:hypothetical protein
VYVNGRCVFIIQKLWSAEKILLMVIFINLFCMSQKGVQYKYHVCCVVITFYYYYYYYIYVFYCYKFLFYLNCHFV